MRIANRLGVLFAMALAALAFAATTATASAATVTPIGDYTATERGAGTLSNGTFTVICTLSHVTATVAENGAVVIETVSFTSCQTLALVSCTVVVTLTPTDGSPLEAVLTDGEPTDTSPTAMTINDGETPSGNVTCGGTTCTFGADTALTFTVLDAPVDPVATGEITVSDTLTRTGGTSGALACGGAASWDSVWTVTEPDGGTIEPPSFT